MSLREESTPADCVEGLKTSCSRPPLRECPHTEYADTGETGSTWMSFVDPQFGPAVGYRKYKVCVCAACGARFGVAPEGTSSCDLTGL